MSAWFGRYRCPGCGGALSRTYLYPRAPIYELQFPSYRVPVLRICVAIVAVGVGFAFVHVALSALGVLAVGAWVWWNYYSALQCDGCSAYYISGQFAGGKGQLLPWRPADTRTVLRRAGLALLVVLVVFVPIYLVEAQLTSRCSATCSESGLRAEVSLQGLRCICVK